MSSTVSRRSVLVGAAAASASIGAPLPAGAGISPQLAKLLEQRERLNTEIVRLLAPFKSAYPRVPDAIRIDPKHASPQLLQSGCASFQRAEIYGEDCLWATGGWWEDVGDKKRLGIAMRYALDECSEWDRLTTVAWELAEAVRLVLGDLEYEIAKIEVTNIAELRAQARVVNEQFLSGRTDFGVIPYSFIVNVLRVIG